MKKVITLVLLLSPVLTQAKLLNGTNSEVVVDNTVFERVFVQCIDAFKNRDLKPEQKVPDIIESCTKSSREIAAESEYVSTDARYYITIVPKVKLEAGAGIKSIPAKTDNQ